MRLRRRRRWGEVRLGVTCAKEIRPPHSVLNDRPGEGSANTPETRTSLHPSAAITLSLGHHSLCLSLRLYHPLHHPFLPPSRLLHLSSIFSFRPPQPELCVCNSGIIPHLFQWPLWESVMTSISFLTMYVSSPSFQPKYKHFIKTNIPSSSDIDHWLLTFHLIQIHYILTRSQAEIHNR